MKNITLAVLIALSTSVVAQAVSITEFVEITSGTFDSATDGNRTYAYRINTNGNDWTNSDLRIELTSGSIIHHLTNPPFGSPVPAPDPQDPFIGDSAVWSPIAPAGDFGTAFPAGTSIANPVYDNTVENATFWDVSWFNTATTDIGIFDIGMITLSPDANGTISYRTVSFDQTLGESQVEDGGYGNAEDRFAIVDGQIVPEPGTLALASLAVAGLLGARRRS